MANNKNEIRVDLENGKYEWIFREGNIYCKRYGKDWRDETGDGSILALIQEVDELRCKLKSRKEILETLRRVRMMATAADKAYSKNLETNEVCVGFDNAIREVIKKIEEM